MKLLWLLALLPKLTLPTGAILLSGGGGGNRAGWANAEQNFISTATPAEIDLHFRPQLEAVGWVVGSYPSQRPRRLKPLDVDG